MKKLAIVAAVVIVIAVLLITVVFSGVISRPAGDGTTPPPADVIEVPGGPKIKVIFNGPSGLEMKWEKLEADSLWQLIVSGTLKNTTSQTIIIEEMGFLLDGDQKAYWPTASYVLMPGGQVEVAKGVVGVNENSKTLEVRVLRFRIAEDAQPTATPTTSPTPTQPSQTFTSAPNNPTSPEEIVAAFYWLWYEEKYTEAVKLVSANNSVSADDLRIHREEVFKRRALKSIRIKIENGRCGIWFYFNDGTDQYSSGDIPVMENGLWRLKWS